MCIVYIKRPRLAIVRFSNGRFHRSIAIEPTIRKPNHPNTEHENVRYSNGFGIRMFGIRALTVFRSHETLVLTRK